MVCKDEMGFVRQNTRYEAMRHLVYASHNGTETQSKTLAQEKKTLQSI